MGLLVAVFVFASCWAFARLLRHILPRWAALALGYAVFLLISGGGVIFAGYWVWLTLGYPGWAPLTLFYAALGLAVCLAGNALRATLQRPY
jgi:hypothetical protein